MESKKFHIVILSKVDKNWNYIFN